MSPRPQAPAAAPDGTAHAAPAHERRGPGPAFQRVGDPASRRGGAVQDRSVAR